MAEPLTVVTWRWHPQGPRQRGAESEFKAHYVNVLAAMIGRHLPDARFVCITDDPEGLKCEWLPCPDETGDLAKLGAPKGVRFPSSYRRLWNFSPQARAVLGPRILALDIDVIVTGSLAPIVNRPEDFVTWWDPNFKWGKVPGGIYLHRTGTLPFLWTEFDPNVTPKWVANSKCPSPVSCCDNCRGSDQGWMSYRLLAKRHWTEGPHPLPHWTRSDGVWSSKWLGASSSRPPKGARIISTPGFDKPWTPKFQKAHPWICEYWCE